MLMDILTIFGAVVSCAALAMAWGRWEIEAALAEKVEEQDREIDDLRDDLAEFARLAATARTFKPVDLWEGHP
jgi:hypothetical protein